MMGDKRKESGHHPAVIKMREKLASVSEHTTTATSELDAALAEYLKDLKTPIPPADDSAAKKA